MSGKSLQWSINPIGEMRYDSPTLARSTLLCTVLALVVLLLSALAQNPETHPETLPIVVNVFDAQGKAVRDLGSARFRVVVNGRPATVRDAHYSLAPRRVVVLLDISGSMRDSNERGKWLVGCEAAQDFLSLTPHGVQIAMLTFSDRVHDVFGFDQSRGAMSQWLVEHSQHPERMKPASTALFNAIGEALRVLQPPQLGDAIYVISDGEDNVSGRSPSLLKTDLERSGVRIFSALLTEPAEAYMEQPSGPNFHELVQDSGGYAFSLSGRARPYTRTQDYLADKTIPEKIKQSTHNLNVMINGLWTLDLAIPPLSKKGKMRLEIDDENGAPRKDLVISYPRYLFPPG